MICRHEGVCGGCGWQPVPYAEQLQRKRDALVERLPPSVSRRVAREPVFLPVFETAPWRYRQKVAFVFGPRRGSAGLIMGHYERGTRRLVPASECPVHSARGNRIAFALRDALVRADISAAGPDLAGLARHVIVRTTRDDREAVAMLVVTRNDRRLRKPVRALLDSPDRPDGFYVNVHDGPGPFMVGDESILVAGRAHVRERVNGLSYLISPTAFFQTNVQAAEALQRLVVGLAGASPIIATSRRDGHTRAPDVPRVLDLYAGSGLFALPLAAAGARVVAVEENRQAVRDAEANLRLNRLRSGQVRLIAARVEEALVRVDRDGWDAVIVDPPRLGCAAGVLDAVCRRLAPRRLVYVSCNPEALARELPALIAGGYRVDAVHAVDMFPHTDHIETVVGLTRR